MLDFLVASVPASLVIVAIVEALKRLFKIEGDRAIVLAVGVGVVVAVAAQTARMVPTFALWWETVVAGVLLGLAACGLFDAGKAVREKYLPR